MIIIWLLHNYFIIIANNSYNGDKNINNSNGRNNDDYNNSH